MTQVNKNDRVRLTDIDPRLHSLGLRLYQEGTVICTRQLPSDDGPKALVDFDGYTGHLHVDQDQIEPIIGRNKTWKTL